ncbi:MAG: addiction module toxin RelE [Chitinophagaceae bacterium]|nr:addiction module toxin RelE [Chitinophagaceae bacterium]
MKVTVRLTKNFKSELKPLMKKFKSLPKDLLLLEKKLIQEPRLGFPLGNDCYKIRLKITSKGKGKSGGARIITLVENEIIGMVQISEEEEIFISFLSIYDKSAVGNISDKELKELIKLYKRQ